MRFPFPNVDLGITAVSVLQNTRGSTFGRERAHYSENKSVMSKSQEFSGKFKRSGVCFNDLWRVLQKDGTDAWTNAWWALISAHFGYQLTLWMSKHSNQLKTLALLSWHLKWWSPSSWELHRDQIQFANMYGSSSVLHKACFLYKLPWPAVRGYLKRSNVTTSQTRLHCTIFWAIIPVNLPCD